MILTLKDFLQKRRDRGENWPSRGMVYQKIFYDDRFAKACIRRLGKKIFVDEEGFNSWLSDSIGNESNFKVSNGRK